MKVKVNLNDKVRVKLTPAGFVFVQRHAQELTIAADGTVETELWQLAATFAPMLYNGNPAPPFKDMEVEIVFRNP